MAFRIAVIDDEEAFCRSLARILSREGYEVACSVDPYEAENLLDRAKPGLVIMDVRMPGRGGLWIGKTKGQNAEWRGKPRGDSGDLVSKLVDRPLRIRSLRDRAPSVHWA